MTQCDQYVGMPTGMPIFHCSIVNRSEPLTSDLLTSPPHTLTNVVIIHKCVCSLRRMSVVGRILCTDVMAAVKAVTLAL